MIQNVCLVTTQSINEGVWTPETQDKALKSVVSCISRPAIFDPKLKQKDAAYTRVFTVTHYCLNWPLVIGNSTSERNKLKYRIFIFPNSGLCIRKEVRAKQTV